MSLIESRMRRVTYYVRFVQGGITQTRLFTDLYRAQAFRSMLLRNPNIESVSPILSQ